MKSEQTIPIKAHCADTINQRVGNGLPAQGRSKSELLAELMSKPETYEKIGSAWRLTMRLLTSNDGKLIGSYKDMAQLLGAGSGDSVKNWSKHLVKKGIITSEQMGHQIMTKLTDEYMRIATAPDKIELRVEVLPPGYADLKSLRKVVDGARELGGRVKLSLEDCELGKDDGTQTT